MIKVLVGIKPKPHDRSEAGPFLCPCQGQFPDLHPVLGPCTLKGSMFALTSSFCHLEILNNFWMRHSNFHCALSSTNYVADNTLYQCSVILCYSSNWLLNCMWILLLFAGWPIMSSGFAKIHEAPMWVIFNSPCALDTFNCSLLLFHSSMTLHKLLLSSLLDQTHNPSNSSTCNLYFVNASRTLSW